MKLLELRDTLLFRVVENTDSKQHFFETKDSKSETGHSLIRKFAVTHSGLITGNNALYLPDRMRRSISTMLANKKRDYPIPFTINHEDEGKPVGRVLNTQYIDTSKELEIKDAKLRDFNTGGLFGNKFEKTVAYMRDSYFSQDDWKGTGYVLVEGRISDPEVIQMVLDQRYIGISSGHLTNASVCSHCFHDWLDEGPCKHRPGSVIDGKKVCLIAGDFFYDHISFVNNGADPFARVVDTDTNQVLTDASTFKDMMDFASDKKSFYMTDFIKTEVPMTLKDRITSIYISLYGEDYSNLTMNLTNPEDKDPHAVLEALMALFHEEAYVQEDFLKSSDDDAKSTISKLVDKFKDKHDKKEANKKEEKEIKLGLLEDSLKAELDTLLTDFPFFNDELKEFKEFIKELPLKDSVNKSFDTYLFDFLSKKYGKIEPTDLDQEKFWDTIKSELESTGLMDKVTDKSLYDAKLSTEARKKLKDSDFCAPGRNFPSHDCAHVTAGRRLLGRYKGEGSKDKILSCINRKAKSLGCDVKKDALESQTSITEIQAKEQLDALKKQFPSLFASDQNVKTLQAEIKTLSYLHDSLEEELISIKKELKGNLADMLMHYTLVRDGKVEKQEEKMKDFLNRSEESLRDSLKDIKEVVNLDSISFKSPEIKQENNPTVTLPVLDSLEKKVETEQPKQDSLSNEKTFAMKQYQLLSQTNKQAAFQFRQKMIEKGIFN